MIDTDVVAGMCSTEIRFSDTVISLFIKLTGCIYYQDSTDLMRTLVHYSAGILIQLITLQTNYPEELHYTSTENLIKRTNQLH